MLIFHLPLKMYNTEGIKATVKKKKKEHQTLLHKAQSGLSLCVSPMPCILRVPLDPAESGPWQNSHFLKNFPQSILYCSILP